MKVLQDGESDSKSGSCRSRALEGDSCQRRRRQAGKETDQNQKRSCELAARRERLEQAKELDTIAIPTCASTSTASATQATMVGAAIPSGIIFPPCFIEEGIRTNTECHIRMLEDANLPHCMARLGAEHIEPRPNLSCACSLARVFCQLPAKRALHRTCASFWVCRLRCDLESGLGKSTGVGDSSVASFFVTSLSLVISSFFPLLYLLLSVSLFLSPFFFSLPFISSSSSFLMFMDMFSLWSVHWTPTRRNKKRRR